MTTTGYSLSSPQNCPNGRGHLCFPQVRYKWDGRSNRILFANGSSILFGGLDDSIRTEKILGLEFATIYLN